MTEEADCVRVMYDAATRLKALGWRDAAGAPVPTWDALVIEPGSTGIHAAYRDEIGWWIVDGGDVWPSRPSLWRPKS